MDWKRSSLARRTVALGLEQLEDRTVPTVFDPAQIKQAYGFNDITFTTSTGQTIVGNGAGQTIAIVDAYDDPNISSDLATFDRTMGIAAPPSFTVMKQSGVVANNQWATEISLDVEWAHAIAPGARIILGEARSDSLSDLVSEADNLANQPNVSVVSMSWNAGEWTSEASFDYSFLTPAGHEGVTFVASSGDSGNQASWPSASPNVLSVGGTTLNLNSSGNYASESGWSGSGGGVSQYESKPAYQYYVSNGASLRTTPDVAYDANPSTGFYVYDSYENSGWLSVGGTSAGAPQWAALIAIADQGRYLAGKTTLDGASQTLYAIYRMSQSSQYTYFHDVTSGNNGGSAGSGYDQVTGNGSPIAYMVVDGLVAWNGNASSGYVNSSFVTALRAKKPVNSNADTTSTKSTGTTTTKSTGTTTTTKSSSKSTAHTTVVFSADVAPPGFGGDGTLSPTTQFASPTPLGQPAFLQPTLVSPSAETVMQPAQDSGAVASPPSATITALSTAGTHSPVQAQSVAHFLDAAPISDSAEWTGLFGPAVGDFTNQAESSPSVIAEESTDSSSADEGDGD
jgi:subtilase family serine protease